MRVDLIGRWAVAGLFAMVLLRMIAVDTPFVMNSLPPPSSRALFQPNHPPPPLPGLHATTLTHVYSFVVENNRVVLGSCGDGNSGLHLILVSNHEPEIEFARESCFASISTCVLPKVDLVGRNNRREFVEAVLRGECRQSLPTAAMGYALLVFNEFKGNESWIHGLANSLLYPNPLAWIVSGPVAVIGQPGWKDDDTRPIVYRLSAHPTQNSIAADLGAFPSFYFQHMANGTDKDYKSELEVISRFAERYKENYDWIRFHLAHRIQINDWLPGDAIADSALPSANNAPPHRLTHLVFALPLFQLNVLKTRIAQDWRDHPPCLAFPTQEQRVHLLLLIALNPNTSLGFDVENTRNQLLRAGLNAYLHCFSNFTICPLTLELEEDTRVYGSKLLFEYFLKGACLDREQSMDYGLYLEPDVTPVKSQWLTALASSVYAPPQNRKPKWIIGSIFLGPSRFVQKKWLPRKGNADKLFFHLNGNAMYWLGREGGGDSFRDFYFDKIKRFIQARHGMEGAKLSAMDLDIFEYLWFDSSSSSARRKLGNATDCVSTTYQNELINRLQYTGLIGNLYFENPNLTASSEFVLIHAKPSDKW